MTPGEPGLQWVRPPQQARSQETLERLLDAAETLIAEKGFEDTPVAEVASRAGSSRPRSSKVWRTISAVVSGCIGSQFPGAGSTETVISRRPSASSRSRPSSCPVGTMVPSLS